MRGVHRHDRARASIANGLGQSAPAPQSQPSRTDERDPLVEPDPLAGEERDNVTTLELDPTRPLPIVGWWVGESHLLELREDRSFVLRRGVSRFADPLFVGRWRRPSHAVFHLEPYDARVFESLRMPLSIVDGHPTVELPSVGPLRRVKAPPRTPEDDLVGTWYGSAGLLVLTGESRYAFERGEGADAVRDVGRWLLDDGVLRLVPDAPRSRPSALLIRRNVTSIDPADGPRDRIIELMALEGTLERLVEKAPSVSESADPNGRGATAPTS